MNVLLAARSAPVESFALTCSTFAVRDKVYVIYWQTGSKLYSAAMCRMKLRGDVGHVGCQPFNS